MIGYLSENDEPIHLLRYKLNTTDGKQIDLFGASELENLDEEEGDTIEAMHSDPCYLPKSRITSRLKSVFGYTHNGENLVTGFPVYKHKLTLAYPLTDHDPVHMAKNMFLNTTHVLFVEDCLDSDPVYVPQGHIDLKTGRFLCPGNNHFYQLNRDQLIELCTCINAHMQPDGLDYDSFLGAYIFHAPRGKKADLRKINQDLTLLKVFRKEPEAVLSKVTKTVVIHPGCSPFKEYIAGDKKIVLGYGNSEFVKPVHYNKKTYYQLTNDQPHSLNVLQLDLDKKPPRTIKGIKCQPYGTKLHFMELLGKEK